MPALYSRPIDNLGRICLPKEIRDSLELQEKDRIAIDVSGEQLILEKIHSRCIVCGAKENLLPCGKSKQICEKCASSIQFPSNQSEE